MPSEHSHHYLFVFNQQSLIDYRHHSCLHRSRPHLADLVSCFLAKLATVATFTMLVSSFLLVIPFLYAMVLTIEITVHNTLKLFSSYPYSLQDA
jgi:hypothetical protein